MTRRLLFVLLLTGTLLAGIASAQTGGQICVRAFEDRNTNGQDDGGEPRITRGLSATLADASGVIVDSVLMEESLNAATGTLCFQRLAAGQYAVRVASADYSATTPDEFVTAITDTGVQVFGFGGQLIVSEAPLSTVDGGLSRNTLLVRLIIGAIGAGIVIGGMALVGILIYLVFLRPRPAPAFVTGTQPVATPAPAPQQPVIAPETELAPPPLFEDEDTDRSRPIEPVDEADDDFEFTDEPDPDWPFKPPEE